MKLKVKDKEKFLNCHLMISQNPSGDTEWKTIPVDGGGVLFESPVKGYLCVDLEEQLHTNPAVGNVWKEDGDRLFTVTKGSKVYLWILRDRAYVTKDQLMATLFEMETSPECHSHSNGLSLWWIFWSGLFFCLALGWLIGGFLGGFLSAFLFFLLMGIC